MRDELDKTTCVTRFCSNCLHEWEQDVTTEELRKIAENKPIDECPVCQMPT